jgi:hypothetical protein
MLGQKTVAARTGRFGPSALTTDVGPGRSRSARDQDGHRARSGCGGAVTASEQGDAVQLLRQHEYG